MCRVVCASLRMAIDWVHWTCTGVELVMIFGLLVYQGVFCFKARCLNWRIVWDRLVRYFLMRPREGSGIAVVFTFAMGVIGLLVVGYPTGFLVEPYIDESAGVIIGRFFNAFLAPGLLEEFIFRGLLVRLPEGEHVRSICDIWGDVLVCLRIRESAHPAGHDLTTQKSEMSSAVSAADTAGSGAMQGISTPDLEASSAPTSTYDGASVAESSAVVTPDPQGSASDIAGVSGVLPVGETRVLPLGATPPDQKTDTDCRIKEEVALKEKAAQLPTLKAASGGRVECLWCDWCTGCRERPHILEQIWLLVLFVVYHQDWIHSHTMFRDVAFLVEAFIIGFTCQELLLQCLSVWPSVVFHWITVFVWLSFAAEERPI